MHPQGKVRQSNRGAGPRVPAGLGSQHSRVSGAPSPHPRLTPRPNVPFDPIQKSVLNQAADGGGAHSDLRDRSAVQTLRHSRAPARGGGGEAAGPRPLAQPALRPSPFALRPRGRGPDRPTRPGLLEEQRGGAEAGVLADPEPPPLRPRLGGWQKKIFLIKKIICIRDKF